MSAPHHRWLHTQLPEWERDGLITAENAATLRQRHSFDDSGPGAAQIAMGVLGALLIGIGLIAIIGYNWDSFIANHRKDFRMEQSEAVLSV